jgi:hypothetical protein
MQTVSAKDHLKALNDQLKAAVAARDEEAKTHILAALSHARAAKAELQAKLQADRANNDVANLHETLGKLDEAAAAAKIALDSKGAQVKDHIKASLVAAQAALAK